MNKHLQLILILVIVLAIINIGRTKRLIDLVAEFDRPRADARPRVDIKLEEWLVVAFVVALVVVFAAPFFTSFPAAALTAVVVGSVVQPKKGATRLATDNMGRTIIPGLAPFLVSSDHKSICPI